MEYQYWDNHLYAPQLSVLETSYHPKKPGDAKNIRSRALIGLIGDHDLIEDCNPSPRILELGCNVGRNYTFLREQWPKCVYLGMDICNDTVRLANESFADYQGVNFVRIDLLEHIEKFKRLEPNSYDLVLSTGVLMHLEHTPRFEELFEQICRISRSGAFCEFYQKDRQTVVENREDGYWLVNRDYREFPGFPKSGGISKGETNGQLKWFWFRKDPALHQRAL